MIGSMQWKNYIAAIVHKGMTQKQLADEAGCGQPSISDLASGKTRDPRSSVGLALIRIGQRLGLDPADFSESCRSAA